MLTVRRFPLEFAEIEGVVREAFWSVISRLAKFLVDSHLYDNIEHELGWVNVTMFEWVNDWPSAEERWLHRFIIFLQSCKPRKGIPFYDGLPSGVMNFNAVPSDVVFVQIYADEPNPMDFLRNRHLYIQSLYNSHMSPAVRREQNRKVILHLIDTSNDPLWTSIYDLLFAGSPRMQANHY